MKRCTLLLAIAALAFGAISCSSTPAQQYIEPQPIDPNAPVTFERNIKALITTKCAPCHTQGGNRNNKWDNYTNLKTQITGVMGRVRKEPDDPLFMPKNGSKLTKEEMDLLNRWIDEGLLER